MDVEVKKLEDEIEEAFLIKKLRMVKQCAYDHINDWDNYLRELVRLLPWLIPYIAKCSDQGHAL